MFPDTYLLAGPMLTLSLFPGNMHSFLVSLLALSLYFAIYFFSGPFVMYLKLLFLSFVLGLYCKLGMSGLYLGFDSNFCFIYAIYLVSAVVSAIEVTSQPLI